MQYVFSAATECRTFLLYYLPILHGILPDKYLPHALLLSKAVRTLLLDRITSVDLEVAEDLLLLFWRLTEQYYGTFSQPCSSHTKISPHWYMCEGYLIRAR